MTLKNARIVKPLEIKAGGVAIRDGAIAALLDHENVPVGLGMSEQLDLRESLLIPGLIDLHIHGSTGIDIQDTDEEGIERLSGYLISRGVTGFFPTLVPSPDSSYRSCLSTLLGRMHNARSSSIRTARVLGIHFEGPFINATRCGALKSEFIRHYDGNPDSLREFTAGTANQSTPRIMTLAPEIQGGLALIDLLAAEGFRVFLGHSRAPIDILELAAAAGATHITHFPNALDPFHHREPGAIGWGLVNPAVTLDCIADMHHVHPLTLKLLVQTKGPDRVALISDAIKPAGLGDGGFDVWGSKVEVTNGRTMLLDGSTSGPLAGSVISLLDGMKNIADLGVPLAESIRMASLTPARIVGLDGRLGSIEEGKTADLVVLDEDLNPTMVWVGGEIVLDRR